MTTAERLLKTLNEEAEALEARRFEALADFQKRKDHLSAQIDTTVPAAVLNEIRDQARANAAQLETILGAVRGLSARFREQGRARAAVGYSADGNRLSCDDESDQRLV